MVIKSICRPLFESEELFSFSYTIIYIRYVRVFYMTKKKRENSSRAAKSFKLKSSGPGTKTMFGMNHHQR